MLTIHHVHYWQKYCLLFDDDTGTVHQSLQAHVAFTCRGDEGKAAFEFLMECGAKYNCKYSMKAAEQHVAEPDE